MKKKRLVIALGGNALGKALDEQKNALALTSKLIADLAKDYEIVISHGNGPQVGMIQSAMDLYAKENKSINIPLAHAVAMSQAYIGLDFENALRNEFNKRDIFREISTLFTQVVVDENDPAFKNPTKSIGMFMSKEESDLLRKKGITTMEDAGRGYRKVVASPKPLAIVQAESISKLLDMREIVIACGGGGVPVIRKNRIYNEVDGVVDKDFTSAVLANEIKSDYLIMLTAVDEAYINYGKKNQEPIHKISPTSIKKYLEEGQFAEGSMKPKVEAAIKFTKDYPYRKAIITSPEMLKQGLEEKAGTIISEIYRN